MNELFIVVGMLCFIGVLYMIEKVLNRDCWHDWNPWTYTETDFCYVQQRTCKKCGYTNTQQFRKLGPKVSWDATVEAESK